MKKGTIILITLLLMVIGYSAYNTTINLYGNSKIAENISDFKVYISSLKVNGNEVSGINGSKDGFELSNVFGTIEYEITNDSTEYDTEASLECETNNTWDFDYTGSEQTLTIPITGRYKLETWGAQGGKYSSYFSGYGGYSIGYMNLSENSKLYINVGGVGSVNVGGYNGGGATSYSGGGGGGATHIATTSGLLSTLENSKTSILIVSGGGGGSGAFNGYAGGSAGGYIGEKSAGSSPGYGGNQTEGGKVSNYTGPTSKGGGIGIFGQGGTGGYEAQYKQGSGAGGSGYYGGSGGGARDGGGGGGSSYIGNSLLTDKSMYCYNCTESSEVSTKTISTTCASSTPNENCAKQGNGYARITLIKSNNQIKTEKIIIEALDVSTKTIENVEAGNLTCKLELNKISRAEKKTHKIGEVWNYDYTGGEQTFIAPVTGTYKLETWGAQGGFEVNIGGYGGYSIGYTNFEKDENIYVNVGGKGTIGEAGTIANGGYNGGGSSEIYVTNYGSSGGGATHIATKSGLLSTLENSKSDILIVSGGGGGAIKDNTTNLTNGNGGSAGGYIGNNGTFSVDNEKNILTTVYAGGGTQTNGGHGTSITYQGKYYSSGSGSFGLGGNATRSSGGGGGGFFGGGGGILNDDDSSGGGGSSYIGNTLLTNKSMYCYNCATSNETSTKTISTTCTSSTPTENCSKQGNGYARITLISID